MKDQFRVVRIIRRAVNDDIWPTATAASEEAHRLTLQHPGATYAICHVTYPLDDDDAPGT